MGEGHKKLNFSDSMGLAIGQISGSGIMVLKGIVMEEDNELCRYTDTFCRWSWNVYLWYADHGTGTGERSGK